jgi:Fe-S-cluster containining protein
MHRNAGTYKTSSQNLCISCGLCCDGTFFARVDLAKEDTEAKNGLVALAATFSIERELEGFCQPCTALENKRCKIYVSRPQICRSFKCDVLKDYENGRIEFEAALGVINNTFRLRNERDASAEGVGIEVGSSTASGFVAKVGKLLESVDMNEKRKYAQLAVNSFALELYISKHFLRRTPSD